MANILTVGLADLKRVSTVLPALFTEDDARQHAIWRKTLTRAVGIVAAGGALDSQATSGVPELVLNQLQGPRFALPAVFKKALQAAAAASSEAQL